MSDKKSAADIRELLRRRYSGETHITLDEVRDAAGFDASRSCDVISLGTWPSRGLTLRGFEVKVSRSDWKRELDDPHKAETFAAYCDEWYVATSDLKVIQPDELPETWGWLVVKGDRLDCVKACVRNRAPTPIDRGLLVALLKRAKEQGPMKSALAAAEEAGLKKGRSQVESEIRHDGSGAVADLRQQLAELRERIRVFEQASGIDLRFSYGDPKTLGSVVRAVLNDMNPFRDRAKYVISELERATATLKKLRDMPDIEAAAAVSPEAPHGGTP